MEIKDRIKMLRKHADINQETLAEKSLVTRVAVTHWESGKNTPNGENLLNLATALNTTPEYILYGTGPIQSSSQVSQVHNENEHDDQQTTFFLPNGATIDVWVDEKGQMQVCATSLGTMLAVLPVTQASVIVQCVK